MYFASGLLYPYKIILSSLWILSSDLGADTPPPHIFHFLNICEYSKMVRAALTFSLPDMEEQELD